MAEPLLFLGLHLHGVFLHLHDPSADAHGASTCAKATFSDLVLVPPALRLRPLAVGTMAVATQSLLGTGA